MKKSHKKNSGGRVERLAYTKSELAKALGISEITIYRLEARKLLTPIPGIRHKLYSVAEVNRFLAAPEVAA